MGKAWSWTARNVYTQVVSAALLTFLSACGGGIDDQASKAPPASASPASDLSAADSARGRRQLNFSLAPTDIPADAYLRGLFLPVANWPLIPAHAVLVVEVTVLEERLL